MRKTLLLVFIFITSFCFAQSISPAQMVKEKSKSSFKNVDLFSVQTSSRESLPQEVKEYTMFKLKNANLRSLMATPSEAIELTLPTSDRSNLTVQLVEVTQPAFNVIGSGSKKSLKYQNGKHYRGIVKGQNKSVVAISFFQNDVMGFISSERSLGNLVIGKMKDSRDNYIIYRDDELIKKLTLNCETPQGGVDYSSKVLHEGESNNRALTDCVKFYYEVDDDIVTEKGGATQAVDYITGLHNQVAALYAAENINVVISEIFVWTTTSPYNAPTSSGMLNQFTAYKNGFNGDLAMLLSYEASGGIAYVNTLCNNEPDFRMGFSSIYNTYSTLPNYSWSVNVITHEFGHLFGSQHTHDCVWNGNNTAIDGCVAPVGCADPGLPPVGSGTIMSYCHTTSVGVNFSNGFGPQPGNVIRSSVTNATCLAACSGATPTCTDGIQNGAETGIDCGGPTCPPCNSSCTQNGGELTLTFDDYPSETSWTLTNSSGSIMYSGTNYNNPNATITVPVCLANGCYSFNIYDAFGDGICCLYGQGSYTLVVNGNTVASGGQFANQEITPFCVTQASSCSDGIQNGNETGIDCGGSCPACPTCNDGIQNGNETGVDCGGSCPACPTCSDGIQNGSETGVDCGGSCPACPTCNDGIQNGNESGVDCGGSCPACPTCNDGIQNGNETGVDCGGSCPACPTCNDGIQNGSETGVDCGGSCPACPTCNDGIQNGSETGVDCGGSCPACPTCNDGIQNGNETGVDCGGSCPACPTCSDGIQNGNESGVDCGGSCPACPTCNDGIQNGNETGIDCGGDCGLPITYIDGPTDLCLDYNTYLVPSSGGTWISSDTTVAIVTNDGTVTAVGVGTASFTFTTSGGCALSTVGSVIVHETPSVMITGSQSICVNGTTTLSPTSGGTWKSSFSGIGVVTVTNEGLVTGIAPGVTSFKFTDAATGCSSFATPQVTVIDIPLVTISGATSICPGGTTTLSPATDGVWSSSNVSIAIVNNDGEVTGLSGGTVNFSFTSNTSGCTSLPTDDITVLPHPSVTNNGSNSICIGSTTSLSPSSGGTWLSSNPSIASIDNGVVTGIAQGTSFFTFTDLTTGCSSTPITINVFNSDNTSLTGSSIICAGSTTSLSPSTGGTWTSSNSAIATVDNNGLVYGISSGIVQFTYTNGATGCVSSNNPEVTVSSNPTASISGSSNICIGATTTLSPSSGGTWASSNNAIATVNSSGIVSGISAGPVSFTYTDASTGCTSSPSGIVTINDNPVANITGNSIVCAQSTTSLTPTIGGTWTSSNPSIATVTNNGIVSALSAGNVNFTFTSNAGCASNPTNDITVNSNPTAVVSGNNVICAGSNTFVSPSTGGTWTSSDNGIAVVTNNGSVTGIAAGNATFTYTNSATGCVSNPTPAITVNSLPTVNVTGSETICVGSNTSLSPTLGGTWVSSNNGVATITNNGVVTGMAPGNASFSFTETATGCTSSPSNQITVNTVPTVSITGSNAVCEGGTTTLSPSSGGTWASSNLNVASVSNSGLVTGVSAGSATFIFTSTDGCVSNPTSSVMVINNPMGLISGSNTICAGSTTTLSPSIGGSWISNNPSIASVTNDGIVTGLIAGNATFTFTESTNGCVSNSTLPVTINDNPVATISGSNAICVGSTTTLSPATGGTWTSSNNAVATISNNGVVTGVAAGTATFTFTNSATGCESNPSNPVTINNSSIASVTGNTAICIGSTTTLSPNTGGTWTSSNNAVATVTNGGVVTGVTAGSATFIFTTTASGCISNPSTPISVSAIPIASITGATSICVDATTTLAPATGGTWVSNNTAIATVTNTGVVTGVAAGTVTFTFTNTAGCVSNNTPVVTIKAKPTASITGSSSICVGTTTTLSPTTGGTWTSSNTAIATVTNAGVVTGVSAGSVTFRFTSTATGCPSNPTPAVTINAKPTVAITGATSICAQSTTTLSPTTGGTWVSNNITRATVTNDGIVTGVSAGTVTFTFTSTAGCVSNPTSAVTIKTKPTSAITGSSTICAGSTTTLSPTTGGTWVSSNTAVATVSNSGVVTGVATGTVTFTFTNTTTGCQSNPTPVITVNARPIASITGANAVCVGSTTTLSPTTGGTWASSNVARATVTNAGVVTGVAAGTVTFTFTSSTTGCASTPTPTVTVNAKPNANVSGSASICVGSTTNLSPTTGGTWVSSNPAVATVTNTGVVTGVSAGTVNFTFTNTTTGCTSNPSPTVTVNPKPTASITGSTSVCVGGTTTLSPTTGGTWTSSNNARATVTSAGVVTGVATGTVTFTFTSSSGCASAPTPTVTVIARPTVAITGSTTICIGGPTKLSPTTGGTWTSSNPAIATVSNSGVVTGVSVGTATFTFTNSTTGCTSVPTAAITVSDCANISGSYFETDWDNWVDGGIDAARYTGTNSAEGVWSISLRDNSLVESSMTSPTLSLATYQSVKVEFKFRMVGVETGEDMWLQYSSDGTNWITVKAWVRGSVYANSVFYSDNAILNASQYTLTNNAKFRFVSDASDDTDLFYIDAVIVNGYATPQVANEVVVNRQTNGESVSEYITFAIYPNPATQFLNIDLTGNYDEKKSYEVQLYDATGRSIGNKYSIDNGQLRIDVNTINSGLYFISILDEETVIYRNKIYITH